MPANLENSAVVARLEKVSFPQRWEKRWEKQASDADTAQPQIIVALRKRGTRIANLTIIDEKATTVF